MGKHTIFVLSALTLVWIVLMEGFSWQNMAVGMVVSLGCMHFYVRFLPFKEIENVNFFKLATFPFYLVGQLYVSGIYVLKAIFTGAEARIITLRTNIENESLRVMLADCITLTPGSTLLELKGRDLTVLWLKSEGMSDETEIVDELLKGQLERKLRRAEKREY